MDSEHVEHVETWPVKVSCHKHTSIWKKKRMPSVRSSSQVAGAMWWVLLLLFTLSCCYCVRSEKLLLGNVGKVEGSMTDIPLYQDTLSKLANSSDTSCLYWGQTWLTSVFAFSLCAQVWLANRRTTHSAHGGLRERQHPLQHRGALHTDCV